MDGSPPASYRRSSRLLAAALLAAACTQPAPPEAATTAARTTPGPASEDRAEGVLVTIGGDCSFARGVAARGAEAGWSSVFGAAGETLRAADLAIVDLESPLAPCLPGGTTSRPRLCADPAATAALQAAGIDAVTVANNHALDGDLAGLQATVQVLADQGIVSLGADAVSTGELAAEPFGPIAVVAANLTPAAHPPQSQVPLPSPDQLAAAIAAAHEADPARPVLVLLHLGRELDAASGPREERYATAAIAAGAAAVVLAGAHVMRRLIVDRGVPVHLGLGNLVFDQHDPRALRGALITLRFRPDRPAELVGVTCVDSLTGAVLGCD